MTGYAGGGSQASEGTVATAVLGLALGASAVLVSAGCGHSSTPGQPAESSIGVAQPLTTSSVVTGPRNAEEISPCVDLTPADVAALGLAPSSRQNSDLRGPGASERGCRWTGTDVLVGVLATDVSVEKYKARTDLVGVRPLTIGGLVSLTAQLPNDPRGVQDRFRCAGRIDRRCVGRQVRARGGGGYRLVHRGNQGDGTGRTNFDEAEID